MGAQLSYLSKPITSKEPEDGGDLEKYGVQYGATGMQGWRRNMEDAHVALVDFDDKISLFGVFDGHGGKGVSRYAAKHFPALLKGTEAYQKGEYAEALSKAFLRVDETLREDAGRREVAELDAAGPRAPSQPIAVPRRMLQRYLGGRARAAQSAPAAAAGAAGAAQERAAGAAEQNGQEKHNAQGEGRGDAGCAASGAAETGASGDGPVSEVAARVLEEVAAKEAREDKQTKEATEGDENTGAEEGAEDSGFVEEDVDDFEPEVDDDGNFVIDLEEGDLDDDSEGMESEDGMEEGEEEAWPGEDMAFVDPAQFAPVATPEAQGCTAVVVLIVRRDGEQGSQIFCANAGDSRAVLSRKGEVLALSEDQKPENPGETARIRKAGGFVEHMPGGARVQGDLNLSRAMGDLRYKKPDHLPPAEQILTVVPEVRAFPLAPEDEFMIIGCDGIWEVTSSQEMIDFLRPKFEATPGAEAASLSSLCGAVCDKCLCPSMDAEENEAFDGTGCDNMTVVVVKLRDFSPAPAEAAKESERKKPRTE